MRPSISPFAAALLCLALPASPAAAEVFTGAADTRIFTVDTSTGAQNVLYDFGPVVGTQFRALTRTPSGQLYGLLGPFAFQGALYFIDPATPFTPTTFVKDIGSSLDTIAADPVSGRIYILGKEIDPAATQFPPFFRSVLYSTTTGSEPVVRHGAFALGGGKLVNGLAFDAAGRLYTLDVADQKLLRVDTAHPELSAVIGGGGWVGATSGPFFGLGVDSTGTVLHACGGLLGPGNCFRISLADGSWLGADAFGASVTYAAAPCGGIAAPYGAGCGAGGGPAPLLALHGCPVAGNAVTLEVGGGAPHATALLIAGAGLASVPLGFGCSLLTAPLVGAPLALPLGATGGLHLAGTVPAAVPGTTAYLQAFILDGSSALGAAATNGVALQLR